MKISDIIIQMHVTFAIVLIASALLISGCDDNAGFQETPGTVAGSDTRASGLSTFEQRFGYALGTTLGKQFQRDELPIDIDALTMALRDIEAGRSPQMSDDDMRSTIVAAQEKQQVKQQATHAAQAETNKAEENIFLTTNAAKEGVVSLDSGLQYKVITEGTGAKPQPSDTVSVHYRGTLINGTEFDSSDSHGGPVSFPVTAVVPGWTEALQLMKEGAKWELYIPSELAYGLNGAGGLIGPNSTLIFEIELLSASVENK